MNNDIAVDGGVWCLSPGHRLQWEPSQDGLVLLYPEGMILLNPTAGEILSHCQNQRTYQEILDHLKQTYEVDECNERSEGEELVCSLEEDLQDFLREAKNHGWIRIQTHAST